MRSILGSMLLLCLIASPAISGGLDIGAAEVAYNPCDEALPSREDYLKTVIGPDGDAVYDMQVKYHAWLCDKGAGPAIINTPRLVSYVPPPRYAGITDDDKLHFVFPGGKESTPSAVPLPATGGILAFATACLCALRAMRKTARQEA